MFKYFSTNSIENIKYQLSVLKNSNLDEDQKKLVTKCEDVIIYSKLITRLYFSLEIARLTYFLFRK